jgi:transcriptional regulator GlxA family with amidase domain
MQREFPAVRVEADRIYIHDGEAWTSAGVTAGIDLALALIEDDLGPTVSNRTAALLVVPQRRYGGQSQFAAGVDLAPRSDPIRLALDFAREHLTEPLPVERLAGAASMSVRHFSREFRRETGETPARAVERLRADVARGLLEDGSEPVELIAARIGFGDPERMRRAFVRLYGQPPQTVRRRART